MDKTIKIQEEVKIELEDKIVILEKGDKIRVIENVPMRNQPVGWLYGADNMPVIEIEVHGNLEVYDLHNMYDIFARASLPNNMSYEDVERNFNWLWDNKKIIDFIDFPSLITE